MMLIVGVPYVLCFLTACNSTKESHGSKAKTNKDVNYKIPKNQMIEEANP